jgi:hypothetical protein
MIIEDTLAGPSCAIQNGGDLEYVYQDREGRFPGVSDADTFRDWALDIAHDFEEGVQAFQPKTNSEQKDFAKLRAKAAGFLELIDLAHQIERGRVQKKKQGGATLDSAADRGG